MNTIRGKAYEAFQTNLEEKRRASTSQRFFRLNRAEMIPQKFIKVDKSAKNSSSHLSNPLQEKSLHARILLCNMPVIPLCTFILKHHYLAILFFRHFYYFE